MTDETIDSTNDARSAVRSDYRQLTGDEKAAIREIKHLGAAFIDQCDRLGASRELSLAKTKMEEAVMWATKGVTKERS